MDYYRKIDLSTNTYQDSAVVKGYGTAGGDVVTLTLHIDQDLPDTTTTTVYMTATQARQLHKALKKAVHAIQD